MILHLPSFHFPIKIPSKFQAFSNTPFWISFFRLLMLSGAKMLDFGTPLALSGVRHDAQNRPTGTKKRKFMKSRSAFFGNLEPTCCQGRFRNAPEHHFG